MSDFPPVAIWLPTSLFTAVLMDVWAGVVHRFAWHGPLWSLHASHHRPRRGSFEANDGLSLTHAPISVFLILYGCTAHEGIGREVAFGVGLGMATFGLGYIVVHDGIIHRRLPVQVLRRVPALGPWLASVELAHLRHHEERDPPSDGTPHSLFLAALELRVTRRPSPRLPPTTD